MTTPQHFFLSSTPRTPSPRWQQAFEQGQCIEFGGFSQQVSGLQPQQFTVWLSAEDAQWRLMLSLVREAQPGARVVLLSNAPEPAEGLAALDAGAMGYTHAYALPELLQEVATVIEHGGLWAGPDLLRRLVAATSAALAKLPEPTNGPGVTAQRYASAWATLSGREAQVARCVAEGKSNKEVADQLFISERTIKAHLGSVFEKLGVRDRLQLALLVATISPNTRVTADTTP
jgi:DNA-binding NarL/FixJ family response regulator